MLEAHANRIAADVLREHGFDREAAAVRSLQDVDIEAAGLLEFPWDSVSVSQLLEVFLLVAERLDLFRVANAIAKLDPDNVVADGHFTPPNPGGLEAHANRIAADVLREFGRMHYADTVHPSAANFHYSGGRMTPTRSRPQ